MRTEYYNTQRPALVKWSLYIGISFCLAAIVLTIVMRERWSSFFLYNLGFMTLIPLSIMASYKLGKVIIDDDEGIIFEQRKKEYPIKIADISYVSFRVNGKGKYRAYFIHDNGVRFMDIRTSEKNAHAITEHLLRLNPTIEVRQTKFW